MADNCEHLSTYCSCAVKDIIERKTVPLQEKLQGYARELLRLKMREISEDYWCAGWFVGLEYELWDFVSGVTDTYGTYLSRNLDGDDRDSLIELANDAGGWYYWSDEAGHGEQFASMDRWLTMYEEYKHGLV